MRSLPFAATLFLLAGIAVASVPVASAASCEVYVTAPGLGLVCAGDPWCGQGMCGVEVCAAQTAGTSAVCVLRDEFTYNGCVAYVVGNLGVVCMYNKGTEPCLTSVPATCPDT